MTKYPLCEELGLTIETRYILAADLERILSQAPVVDMVEACQMGGKSFYRTITMADKDDAATHTARLIGIKPIVKDTAESLLKEILEQLDLRLKEYGGGFYKFEASDALERARKLLEEKE